MISINKILYALICLFALVNYYFTTEATFVLAFIAVLFSIWGRGFMKHHLEILFLPILFIILGFIKSYENEPVYIFKDFYYFFNPIIIFSFGYVSAYYISIDKLLKTFVVLGVFLGIAYLLNHNWSAAKSVNALHEEEGVASYLVIIALVILLLKIIRKEQIFSKFLTGFFISILTLTCIIAVSRTFLLIFFILMITGSGQLKFEKFFVLKFLMLVLIFSVFTFFLVNIEVADHSSFIGKLLYSLDEVTISNYDDLGEINNNWRGFEAFMGWQQISKGSFLEWFVGQGFGRTTPIGIEIKLGDEYFTEIPFFHNGFITLILKTGLIGLIAYLIFFIKMGITNFRDKFDYDENYILCKNIIPGLALTLILTTFIISGWLNKSTLAPVIFSLGYFISAKENIKDFYEEENIEDN
ncbi:hypothetical protein ACH3O9_13085 [Leeuwenhoekiella sp. A16]|uniref:hypothetical protein n=1 Tax=unclassified Leeuwenhoekiella TaxID=2615029 RepID=UPI003A810334